jgi:hypothetical protein
MIQIWTNGRSQKSRNWQVVNGEPACGLPQRTDLKENIPPNLERSSSGETSEIESFPNLETNAPFFELIPTILVGFKIPPTFRINRPTSDCSVVNVATSRNFRIVHTPLNTTTSSHFRVLYTFNASNQASANQS